MTEKKERSLRRTVILTLLAATIVFALLLCAGVYAGRRLPEWRVERIEAALSQGKADKARRIALRLSDTELSLYYVEQCDYLSANQLMEEGQYEEAAALFYSLGNTQDAPELARSCIYLQAEALAAEGSLEEASALFGEIAGFRAASERRDQCRFDLAVQLMEQGQGVDAVMLLSSLGNYPGAKALMEQYAMQISGLTDPEDAVNAVKGMSPQEAEHRAALAQAREALPKDILALGFFHTLGLKADGTVLSCGDNSYGQCEVSGWQGVKAVAAGAYHSVALMADGTVKAVGRSSEGQCDVADWTGIVQIAAADYATLGLKADGTLVYSGFLGDMDLSAWTGLESICAGSYSFAAVKADGSALISHETARSDDFKELVALDVNTAYAVGVKNDGSVVSPAFPLEDWQDILTVSAGSTAVLGLDTNGYVHSYFFRSQDAVDFSSVTDAVAIAAGGTHWAFVLADGSVKVFGETDQGQGDTGQWKLFS